MCPIKEKVISVATFSISVLLPAFYWFHSLFSVKESVDFLQSNRETLEKSREAEKELHLSPFKDFAFLLAIF